MVSQDPSRSAHPPGGSGLPAATSSVPLLQFCGSCHGRLHGAMCGANRFVAPETAALAPGCINRAHLD